MIINDDFINKQTNHRSVLKNFNFIVINFGKKILTGTDVSKDKHMSYVLNNFFNETC